MIISTPHASAVFIIQAMAWVISTHTLLIPIGTTTTHTALVPVYTLLTAFGQTATTTGGLATHGAITLGETTRIGDTTTSAGIAGDTAAPGCLTTLMHAAGAMATHIGAMVAGATTMATSTATTMVIIMATTMALTMGLPITTILMGLTIIATPIMGHTNKPAHRASLTALASRYKLP